ncbi:hypothetical protein L1987_37608 [Smallanthus sonchifolius]|uniref:Uncharacterized protein n=1 Tax=Smallanthus sonchifolius TaxID=185202 RepID=A0ACB9HI82_9ASTR|nr:hypothetical protein L1987_37608 [Smallanthus sonchifolius]
MPVCDLDKRVPLGKKVLGLDVVVWWDKNENEWKVFDDRCPHRLAPLSEGRIDPSGRLQCVYHGWCFGGSGDCKLIPQAPLDGPPVHSFPKACVAVYPSTVQNGIVWIWPNTDPQYKDILTKKKPPYIPELDDPSFSFKMFNRDIPYGWVDHILQNLIIDSDLYLLRVEEDKLLEVGPSNYQKACFMPTKSDANVVAFRKWLKKYASGQVDWGTKFNGSLPPIPPREQLMDRYRSHVVNCRSCSSAYKGFNALQTSLRVFSVASVAIMVATKPGMISVAANITLATAAILCFVGSKWLSHFVYKNFHFHDYNHAFK